MVDESPRDTRPDGVEQPGSLAPRIGARLIDAVVVGAIGGAVGVLLDFSFLWLALQALLVFAYFVVLDVTVGTTLGKRLLGLRVTGPGGGTPTVGQAAAREAFTLLGAVPYAGPVLALVAWVAILVTIRSSPTGQGVHDTLARGTAVVTA